MKTRPKTKQKPAQANPMWGGHYVQGPAEAFAAINPSIAVDERLWREDIAASLAHAEMLVSCGIISQKDGRAIVKGLSQIADEIAAGKLAFTAALEDIHMNIESRLKTLIGDAAGRLHTARSRNDQVATDLRLYARRIVAELDSSLQQLQAALLTQAEANTETLMPGFTHLQPAQPICFAHHLLAYVEMFGRDRTRLEDCAVRMNECPLGAAALAGTTFPIDRDMTSQSLGFDAPMRNSLDAVSDRDYVLELLSAFSIISVHLSRLSEEIIFWLSPLVGFVTLPEAFTSGSSIMPQKRNPDAAELIRGKSGAIASQFTSLMLTMKGLPLAYNKDMQEDKRPLFFAFDELGLCLSAMRGMVEGLKAQPKAMRAAAARGYLNATDLADYLVARCNVAFRDAHHLTGKMVKLAETKGVTLEELPLKAMQSICPGITKDVFKAIALDACVARRTSLGGTAPAKVKTAIREARKLWL
jgi:argininosuccinate lyase